MVQYVLKRSTIAGRIAFEPPADAGASKRIKSELRKCRDKHNDFVLVTLQPPKRPRTTGDDYESVKNAVKMIAVENTGYPYNTIGGQIIPQRERDCSTDECAKLIEAAHLLAADLGIILQE